MNEEMKFARMSFEEHQEWLISEKQALREGYGYNAADRLDINFQRALNNCLDDLKWATQ
jgi:hypothetical protein